MPDLATNALTTVGVVLDELSLDYDPVVADRIRRYINAASDRFERWTGRRWYFAEGHVERVAGYGTERLRVVDHVPLSSVASIAYDNGATTSTIDASAYEIEESTAQFPGYIRRRAGVWHDTRDTVQGITQRKVPQTAKKLYIVTYTGGFVTPKQEEDTAGGASPLTRSLPSDVEEAIWDYVVMRYAQRGADQSIRRLSLADGSIEFAELNGERVPSSFARAVEAHSVFGVG